MANETPYRPLSPILEERAKDELGEKSTRLPIYLKHVQDWLDKQPHLNVRKDPQFILSFLRSSKFSLQRTKQKLDYFYTLKTLTPEFFQNKNPFHPEIQEILKNAALLPITRGCEQAGQPSILLFRWGMLDPDKVSYISVVKMALMCLDIMLSEDDNTTITGIRIIHDMKDFRLGYIKQMTPTLGKKVMLCAQAAYPLRIKGFYFINSSKAYEVAYNMVLPFFNFKMRRRLNLLNVEETAKKFHKYIPVDVLPAEYGGTAGTLAERNAEFREILENYADWFVEDQQYGSNESKRPGRPKTSADILGVEGSFRKLSLF